MACLSSHSITRTLVHACLSTSTTSTNNNNINKSKNLKPTTTDSNPPIPDLSGKIRHQNNHLQQKLSVIRIEHALGAGGYRDTEPKDSEQRKSVHDGVLPDSAESSVERKLRETGEWIAISTETGFRSNRKRIFMFVFQWVLPVYLLLLFVAAGIIKLPFSVPMLDDLIL